MEESITIVLLLLFLSFFILWLIAYFLFGFFVVFEYCYGLVFQKPFFVHVYRNKYSLSQTESNYLATHCSFYSKLSSKHKKYFEQRVAACIKKYEFVFHGQFENESQIKLDIAATFCTLTFGFRTYLLDNLKRIIIYPDVYLSNTTGEWHKGEFNPAMQTVVFSWKNFQEGMSKNDNIHLGFHEFMHVLHRYSVRTDNINAEIFKRYFDKLGKLFATNNVRQSIENSGLFREYAFENPYEFSAVLAEHYFENPLELKQRFPKIYQYMSIMLNHPN